MKQPAKKAEVSLAVRPPPGPSPLALRKAYTDSLTTIATALTAAKTVKDIAPLTDMLATAKEDVDALHKIARSKVLTILEKDGESVGESGTVAVEAEGWRLEARRQGGFLEAKKVEAALRAKNIDPKKYMVAEVTFSVDDDLMLKAVKDKVFHKYELELLKRATTFAMQRPVRTKE